MRTVTQHLQGSDTQESLRSLASPLQADRIRAKTVASSPEELVEQKSPNSPRLCENALQPVTEYNKALSRYQHSEVVEPVSSRLETPNSVLEDLLGILMADDPNQNIGQFSQPFCTQNVVSFQTSATTSGSGGMPMYLDCSSTIENNMGMMNTTPSVVVSTSSSSMVADSAQNLKYGGPLAAEWSYLELQVLKDCLDRYVNEHGIMKYIKIAASIPTKTVRDVAMRCQWIGNKPNTRRRRPTEHHSRKMKDRKDNMVGPSSWGSRSSHLVQMDTRVSSFVPNHAIQNSDSEIDRAVQHVLDKNNQLLNQIDTNIQGFQVQNNIDLFHRVRTNIDGLLRIMSQMPGKMSEMPRLPVSVNENLANYLLPDLAMAQVHGKRHLKEEPRGW